MLNSAAIARPLRVSEMYRDPCRVTKPDRRTANREEEKMYKQYEEEPSRIEHEDDATITFTIALHSPHVWEILLEDSRRYHSISHGWATDDPHDWEDAIAPLRRRFFVKN